MAQDDTNRGVYYKYEVRRLNDPAGKHANCTFFVLDLNHDEFAVPALRAYARACRKKFPALAKDLLVWYRYKNPRTKSGFVPQWVVRLHDEAARVAERGAQ